MRIVSHLVRSPMVWKRTTKIVIGRGTAMHVYFTRIAYGVSYLVQMLHMFLFPAI